MRRTKRNTRRKKTIKKEKERKGEAEKDTVLIKPAPPPTVFLSPDVSKLKAGSERRARRKDRRERKQRNGKGRKKKRKFGIYSNLLNYKNRCQGTCEYCA